VIGFLMSYAEPPCELVARNAQSDATMPDAGPNERIEWIRVFAHRDISVLNGGDSDLCIARLLQLLRECNRT